MDINQRAYFESSLNKFKIQNCKSINNLNEVHLKLVNVSRNLTSNFYVIK